MGSRVSSFLGEVLPKYFLHPSRPVGEGMERTSGLLNTLSHEKHMFVSRKEGGCRRALWSLDTCTEWKVPLRQGLKRQESLLGEADWFGSHWPCWNSQWMASVKDYGQEEKWQPPNFPLKWFHWILAWSFPGQLVHHQCAVPVWTARLLLPSWLGSWGRFWAARWARSGETGRTDWERPR